MDMLTRPQAAEYLTVSVPTLDRLTASGKVPFIRIGSSVRFLVSDLDTFVESCRVEIIPTEKIKKQTKRKAPVCGYVPGTKVV